MLTDDLYQNVLAIGAGSNSNLDILTGYASPQFAFQHVVGTTESKLRSLGANNNVRLVVGMVGVSGIGNLQHRAFVDMAEKVPQLETRYYLERPGVHAKAYIWKGALNQAFVGSANYSKQGFLGGNLEILSPANFDSATEFFEQIWSKSTPVQDCRGKFFEATLPMEGVQVDISIDPAYAGLEHVDLPFTKRGLGKEIHQHSGLNWGIRENYVRDRNQAYIPVPSDVAKSGFFPPRGEIFLVITDDDQIFDCTIAQDGDKAIHTPISNALLGEYFRRRLGVESGAFVTLEDLTRYGRVSVRIYKIDEGNYYMDFKRP